MVLDRRGARCDFIPPLHPVSNRYMHSTLSSLLRQPHRAHTRGTMLPRVTNSSRWQGFPPTSIAHHPHRHPEPLRAYHPSSPVEWRGRKASRGAASPFPSTRPDCAAVNDLGSWTVLDTEYWDISRTDQATLQSSGRPRALLARFHGLVLLFVVVGWYAGSCRLVIPVQTFG